MLNDDDLTATSHDERALGQTASGNSQHAIVSWLEA
jgi:hypothetical protein